MNILASKIRALQMGPQNKMMILENGCDNFD
jgi:hypothetical protein